MLDALQSSSLATVIGQSQAWLASLSAIHLLGFTLVMSSAILANGRLMGVLFADRPVRDVTIPAARLLLLGLSISGTTGALMFITRATTAAASPAFRAKLTLLVVAVILKLLVRVAHPRFEGGALRYVIGVTRLLLWTGVALAACAFILLE